MEFQRGLISDGASSKVYYFVAAQIPSQDAHPKPTLSVMKEMVIISNYGEIISLIAGGLIYGVHSDLGNESDTEVPRDGTRDYKCSCRMSFRILDRR